MPSPLLDQLISALRTLPGVGQKSAQRMAYQLLLRQRPQAKRLAQALTQALADVGQCRRCRDLSEATLCAICQNDQRDARLLCVVESPLDILAFEQIGSYHGRYFVLHGQLSPLDGLGPSELGLSQFAELLAEGQIEEVIIATSPTMEGEATAFYLEQLADAGQVKHSRLAQGIPIGGNLAQLDSATLMQAFVNRR
jgi:recombination protein RecR